MHPYLGAYTAGSTVYGAFNTKDLQTQAPITLAGTPSLTFRKNDTAAPDTSGAALTVDWNSVTGIMSWSCDTSADGTFFAAPSEIFVCIAAGTVDGVSVVGQVIAQFSLVTDGLTATQTSQVQSSVTAGLTAYAPATSTALSAMLSTVALTATSAAVSSTLSAVGVVPSAVMSTAASAGGIHADTKRINATTVLGVGTAGNKWRG